MAAAFITPDFLLQNDFSSRLYHDYAENEPIIDYHSHLPPQQIAMDHKYTNMAQIWLYGDHYKWRQMRTNGVAERYCTGDASDWEKFEQWAKTVPKTLGNPLFHWTHLELNRPFGINDLLLNEKTARTIWDRCNEKLANSEFSCRGLLKQMNVKLVCTTDDPVDSLEWHKKIADDGFEVRVLPTFRPDKGMMVDDPNSFNLYVNKLAEVADIEISTYRSFLDAIRKRHDFFAQHGCRLSDHGIETAYAEDYSDAEIPVIFSKVRGGSVLTALEIIKFKSAMLFEFGIMDYEKGWTQQLHLGALRNNNSRLFKTLGPDTGFDSIGDFEIAKPLSRLLDRLDRVGKLPRTILYNLNPRDNELMATMLGNFQDGTIAGKMQFGSAWWFLDQKSGMERQIDALANLGLLSRFVGMLTDSRSFLSFPRHEYFRRILCNVVGEWMLQGVVPRDFDLVGNMIRDISYTNASEYFGFEL